MAASKSPSTVETWQGCLDKWWLADGRIGDLPLSEVNNDTLRPVIEQMSAAGLKPKTIRNHVQLVEMVVASLTDRDDNPIYPRNWSAKKMNLPAVDKREQNRPSFTGETVTALVATAENRIVQMLFILVAATGLRLGEALGIRIENVLDKHTRIVIDQKAWRNEIQAFLRPLTVIEMLTCTRPSEPC
jgi:integrase